MIGAPIGIDDEVGANVGPRRLDEDVNAASCSGILPLTVSPMIQRTVSPDATGPGPTSSSPSCSMMSVICPGAV